MVLTRRVLVVCDELHDSLLWSTSHLVRSTLTGNLEVDTVAGFRVDTAHVPETCVANTALGLANRHTLLVSRNCVSDQTGNLELLRCEDLQTGVEAHEQVVVGVLVEDSGERLLVHGRCEAVCQDHVSSGHICQTSHLEQADLVETSGKDIDDMAVVCDALGQSLVELEGLLVVLDVVAVDVVVGADGLTQLRANHHSRSLGRWATGEEHDARSGATEAASLEEASCNTQSNSRTPQRTLVVGHWPGVSLELLERIRELELTLSDGQNEARGGGSHGGWWLSGSRLHARARGHLTKANHLLDLLGRVVLAAAEDVRLGALGVAQLVHLRHGAVCDETDKGVGGQQAQAHDDGVLEGLQAVLLLARVHAEEEDGRVRGRLGQAVLDGGAVRVQLGGDLLGGDVLVVRRQLVAVEAEGAYPLAGAHVDLAGVCQYRNICICIQWHTSMG